MRRRPLAVLLCLPLALAACGRERIPVPEAVAPAPPRGVQPATFPQAGVTFQAPGGWRVRRGAEPLLATTSSGTAVVAIWRYPRSAPLPREDEALDEAEQRLEEAIRTRDETFEIEETRRVEVDGAPAIEVTGTGTIEGERRRVRSTHAYAKGHELVVDAYAAPQDFERLDRQVFQPLVESLKIDPPTA